MIKEVKESLTAGQNIYIRGFGSFITKKRAAKIGRNIKKIQQFIFQNIISLHLNQQKNLLPKLKANTSRSNFAKI
jgi:nucleoid DNA-binding protein